jgi:hypothetical protein
MRRNSKADIPLEVLEQFRIYLILDVIFQCSGIARLCICQRQTGADDRGPAYILQPRDYGVAKQRTGFGPKLPIRRERPAAWKGSLRPRGRAEDSPSLKAAANEGVASGGRKA